MIREIEGVNLDRDLRQFTHDDRFVAYIPGGYVSEAQPFSDAVREAAALSGDACVGFLEEPLVAAEPAPDYSEPVPSYLGKRKRKT